MFQNQTKQNFQQAWLDSGKRLLNGFLILGQTASPGQHPVISVHHPDSGTGLCQALQHPLHLRVRPDQQVRPALCVKGSAGNLGEDLSLAGIIYIGHAERHALTDQVQGDSELDDVAVGVFLPFPPYPLLCGQWQGLITAGRRSLGPYPARGDRGQDVSGQSAIGPLQDQFDAITLIETGVAGPLVDPVVVIDLEQHVEIAVPCTNQAVKSARRLCAVTGSIDQVGLPVFRVAVQLYVGIQMLDVDGEVAGLIFPGHGAGNEHLIPVAKHCRNGLGRTPQTGFLGVAQELLCFLNIAITCPGDYAQAQR